MKRYGRSRFLAFGVLPIANTAALLIYGLELSTNGTGGAGRSLPALVVMAGVCLLLGIAAAIKRGRDVGWSAWLSLAAFWVGLGMGPVLLGVIGYLAFAKPTLSADRFGPPTPPATAETWAWALANLIWPWAALGVLARVL